jgi:hypothetical protein
LNDHNTYQILKNKTHSTQFSSSQKRKMVLLYTKERMRMNAINHIQSAAIRSYHLSHLVSFPWVNFREDANFLCKRQLKQKKVLFYQQTSIAILFWIIVSIEHFIDFLQIATCSWIVCCHILSSNTTNHFKIVWVDISNQQLTQIVLLLSCTIISFNSILNFKSHQFNSLSIHFNSSISTSIHWSQYLCPVLQRQVIHCIKHTQNQLEWNMFVVNNISRYSRFNIDRIMNEHNLNTIHTIKLWNDLKLKTQLHNCISQMDYNITLSVNSVLFHDSHHINSFIQKLFNLNLKQHELSMIELCTLFKCFWLWSNCVFNNIKHQHTHWLIDFKIAFLYHIIS